MERFYRHGTSGSGQTLGLRFFQENKKKKAAIATFNKRKSPLHTSYIWIKDLDTWFPLPRKSIIHRPQ